jgi:hypothetical protein
MHDFLGAEVESMITNLQTSFLGRRTERLPLSVRLTLGAALQDSFLLRMMRTRLSSPSALSALTQSCPSKTANRAAASRFFE